MLVILNKKALLHLKYPHLPSNETNDLTNNNIEAVDEKIKDITSNFLSKNPAIQTKLAEELGALSTQGSNMIKKESVAFRKNLSSISSLRYL